MASLPPPPEAVKQLRTKTQNRQERTRASNYLLLGVSQGEEETGNEQKGNVGSGGGTVVEIGLGGKGAAGGGSESGRAPFGLWDGLWSCLVSRLW